MARKCSSFVLRMAFAILSCFALIAEAQDALQIRSEIPALNAEHIKKREEWFYRGRTMGSQSSAALRRRALQQKLRVRGQRAAIAIGQTSLSSGTWTALGPVPLASDASGNGTQDYGFVAGRATAVVIDPADSTGNTVYVGGAQSGIWKSTNAASPDSTTVTWTPIADNQDTLAIGAIAIQPGNSDPAKSLILAATGEANNSGDSYFGLGILRSTDAGATWTLVRTANNGALSFEGLGGARMAFSSASGQTNVAVAAMAVSPEGLIDGAVSSTATPGLYTSLDSGQSWTYNALSDPSGTTDATSATSVTYNAAAGLFIAAVRYHGFYSSRDGVNWTRLAAQPGGPVLGTAVCPPRASSNNNACPIYRGEITVVPGRNEMYVWYVSLTSGGAPLDMGIWKSGNGGVSWTSIAGSGIANCGDFAGCGVEQGAYNLALLAVPNGADTDLYAGAINLYKCGITSVNPNCSTTPFLNLTHAYGCDPTASPAHVHPAQHAMASMTPATGGDSGNALLYFANDGGLYRALNGYSGLMSGACSGVNAFDNLNQNLGSMTQFVSLSQHPTDANTIFGGAQGNGFPASNQATNNPSWWSVLGGDGGDSAIDVTATSNWYAANPDVPPGGLGVQHCTQGAQCDNSLFDFVATSSTLGGDDGGFYVPFILDPHASAMLIGTCRVWRGQRTGGAFVMLSPNFDTLGSGTCSGSEVNQVRSLAAGGLYDQSGSSIIYVTTNGLGPIEGPSLTPVGGRVWVTTDSSSGTPAFADVTNNGPQGNINPNQFPISSVATDSSDATGHTAYVTVMGFTSGTGHVWKTTNAGAGWTDFTANLPDSPANAVVVYPGLSQVYVATDVGVFGSSTATPSWTELGPAPSTNQAGFLPNVVVTALSVFASGGQQSLRAATYGRGIWSFDLVLNPDFQIAISNSPLTVFAGQTAAFNGTATAKNGYANSVVLTCVAGDTAPPPTCTPSPASLTPGSKTPFTVTVGGPTGDYSFNVQGAGLDANRSVHTVPVTLHLLNFGMTSPQPATLSVPRGTTSSPVSFQITAAGSFNQSVAVSCTSTIPAATCALTPGTTVNPTSTTPVSMTASVSVPPGTTPGAYTATLQATTAGAPSPLTSNFTLNVTSNPDFVLTEPIAFPEINAGSSGATGVISIASEDGFSGTVALTCSQTYGAGSCSLSPTSVSAFPATSTLTINGTTSSAGSYSLTVTGTSHGTTHILAVPFMIGDYSISGPQTLPTVPGSQVSTNLSVTSLFNYSGKINATCDASALNGTMCSLSPGNPISLAAGGTSSLNANINVPSDALPGNYAIKVNLQDVAGSPSHSTAITLAVAQDFRVTSSTPSQTVAAGQTSGPYSIVIQPVGSSYDAAVTLACTSGLPPQAQCAFNPAGPVTPGNSAVDVVMSISTKANKASVSGGRFVFYAMLVSMASLVIAGNSPNRKGRKWRFFFACAIALTLLSLVSCAGGVGTNGGGGGIGGNNPITYHITVTGTSPGTPADVGQNAVVILVVD